MSEHRRNEFKGHGDARSRLDRARAILLERQKDARRDLTDHARALVKTASKQDKDTEFTEKNRTSQEQAAIVPDEQESVKVARVETVFSKQKREYYARQLMYPQWMSEIPGDLTSDWFILPRPEGTRCLVVSSRGLTVSRKRNGTVLHRFPSALPDGSGPTRTRDGFCILDCIFHKPTKTYYVLDMMAWKAYSLYDSDTEFRFYWIHSKLSETSVDSVSQHNKYRFAPLPFREASPAAFSELYHPSNPKAHGFLQDGFLFYSKQTHYVLGSTPLTLLWKDSKCSPFVVDTDDGKTVSDLQVVTLSVHPADRTVRALEGEVLGVLPQEFIDKHAFQDSQLLRFFIKGVDHEAPEPSVKELVFAGEGSQSRLLADSWSKVVYQDLARTNRLITAEQLLSHLQNPPTALSGSIFDPFASFSSSGSASTAPGAMQPEVNPFSVAHFDRRVAFKESSQNAVSTSAKQNLPPWHQLAAEGKYADPDEDLPMSHSSSTSSFASASAPSSPSSSTAAFPSFSASFGVSSLGTFGNGT